jgi:hypothetical protein
MVKNIEAMIVTPQEIEEFAVQLFVKDGDQWAEIDQESGTLEIEIWAYPGSPSLRFNLDELEKALKLAGESLVA